MGKRIYIEGDGCSRRLLEQAKFRLYLAANDYEVVDSPAKAEIIFVSTCAFKQKEEDQSVERLRELRKYGAEMLVYGCLPDIAPSRYREFSDIRYLAPKDLDKVDSFFQGITVKYDDVAETHFRGPAAKGKFGRGLRQKLLNREILTADFYSQGLDVVRARFKGMIRAKAEYNLMVARGCLGKCTYCAIRHSIGRVQSKPLDVIVEELRGGVKDGYRQFVIMADDPGCYGQDSDSDFPTLLGRLIQETDRLIAAGEGASGNGDTRIGNPSNGDGSSSNGKSSNGKPRKLKIHFHIRDVHPKWLIQYEKELSGILARPEFASFLCPLQSGSDRILGLMQREHTAQDYLDAHLMLKSINPGMELYSQLIAGFPSETEQDFDKSLDLVSECKFTHVQIFPYHEKENSIAGKMEGKIPEKAKQERMKKARKVLTREGIRVYFRCPL